MTSLINMKRMVEECNGRTPSIVKRIIERYINQDPMLKELLRYVYSPMDKYYYKMESEEFFYHTEAIFIASDMGAMELIAFLERLKKRNFSSNRDRDMAIEDFLHKRTGLLAFFLYKTLDCGFGQTGARDLGIIDAHNPQKGVLVKSTDEVRYPIVADVKYNGIRLTAYAEYGDVEFKLLKGNEVLIPDLKDWILLHIPQVRGYVLDGELISGAGITEEDRLLVSGRVNRANNNKSGLQPLSMNGLQYVIYDIVPISNFRKAHPLDIPYTHRRRSLEVKFEGIPKDAMCMLSEQYLVHDSVEMDYLLARMGELNGEGFMLKPANGTYDFKKNKSWLKMKLHQEADLRIVGYNEHSKNRAWIGSLVCEGIIDGKVVTVNVGSGLNDTDRPKALFEEVYRDAIVMVAYLSVLYSTDSDTYSLSNPRFIKPTVATPLRSVLRIDKTNPVNY